MASDVRPLATDPGACFLEAGKAEPPQPIPDVIGKERESMKLSLHSKAATLVLLLFAAMSVFAGTDNHKGGLSLTAPAQIGGTQLEAGDYAVKWDGAGPAVQLNILQNGKVVATVPAQVVSLDKKSAHDQADISTGANGERTVTRLQFQGKTLALQITGEAADAKSGGEMK